MRGHRGVAAAQRHPRPHGEVAIDPEGARRHKNLAAARTDKLEELRAEWEKLNTQMIEPIWTRPRR